VAVVKTIEDWTSQLFFSFKKVRFFSLTKKKKETTQIKKTKQKTKKTFRIDECYSSKLSCCFNVKKKTDGLD